MRLAVQPKGGFTLAEVVVAVFVLALTVMSANLLLGTLLRAQKNTETAALADAAIRSTLNELRLRPYSGVLPGTDVVDRVRCEWRVTATNGVKTVAVTASWTDIDGHRQELNAGTLMAD